MRIRFHNRAVKFLDKIDEKDKERIRLKIGSLVGVIEEQGIIPFPASWHQINPRSPKICLVS